MKLSSRTALIFVCFILILFVLVFGLMWSRRIPPTPPFDGASAHAQWTSYVSSTILMLPATASIVDIQRAREGLVALTIPGSDREVHFSLVMALLAWERGETDAQLQVRTISQKIQ